MIIGIDVADLLNMTKCVRCRTLCTCSGSVMVFVSLCVCYVVLVCGYVSYFVLMREERVEVCPCSYYSRLYNHLNSYLSFITHHRFLRVHVTRKVLKLTAKHKIMADEITTVATQSGVVTDGQKPKDDAPVKEQPEKEHGAAEKESNDEKDKSVELKTAE